jgi:5-deoxy-glucuronate isomerase
VTPAGAGWSWAGFALHRLVPGGFARGATGATEAILVLVEGRARIAGAGEDWGEIGERLQVFERLPPHAVYLPPGSDWRVEATTDLTLAVCTAPAARGREAARIGPQGIVTETRGRGSNTRYVNAIAMEDRDVAERLLVTEVYTPAGNWSSYPPHRHDEDGFPDITLLEETYYHRLDPPQAFGLQRVYTEDGSLDETMAVHDHDVVLVPRGHHPCAAPHGCALYYLNVMAGPLRRWRFRTDPAFDWLTRS